MKSSNQISRRIQKLRFSYMKKYVKEGLHKHPHNCQYNHVLRSDSRSLKSRFSNSNIAPRKQVTLLVLKEENSVRVCTYGLDSKEWNGTICDSDSQSQGCPYFKPVRSESDLESDFYEKSKDDSYVKENYPDVAALQWVLERRFYDKISDWFLRFPQWIKNLFYKEKLPQLPSHQDGELDKVWNENP